MGKNTTIESMLTLWASESDERFEPERLHSELGVTATKFWKKNDPFPAGKGVRKQSGWQYSSGRQDYFPETNIDFFSQLSLIKTFLKTHKAQIISVCEKYFLTPELSCVMYVVGSDRPGIGYDKELVSLLAEVGAEIDVDVFFFTS